METAPHQVSKDFEGVEFDLLPKGQSRIDYEQLDAQLS